MLMINHQSYIRPQKLDHQAVPAYHLQIVQPLLLKKHPAKTALEHYVLQAPQLLV